MVKQWPNKSYLRPHPMTFWVMGWGRKYDLFGGDKTKKSPHFKNFFITTLTNYKIK